MTLDHAAATLGRKRKTTTGGPYTTYTIRFQPPHTGAPIYRHRAGSTEPLNELMGDVLRYYADNGGPVAWGTADTVDATLHPHVDMAWTVAQFDHYLRSQGYDIEAMVHVVYPIHTPVIPEWSDLYTQDKVALHVHHRIHGTFQVPQGHLDDEEAAWIYWSSPRTVTYGRRREEHTGPTRYLLQSGPLPTSTWFRLSIRLTTCLTHIENASDLLRIGVGAATHAIDLRRWVTAGDQTTIRIVVTYDRHLNRLTLRHPSHLLYQEVIQCAPVHDQRLTLRADYPTLRTDYPLLRSTHDGHGHPQVTIDLEAHESGESGESGEPSEPSEPVAQAADLMCL